jgi:hypothetical protein
MYSFCGILALGLVQDSFDLPPKLRCPKGCNCSRGCSPEDPRRHPVHSAGVQQSVVPVVLFESAKSQVSQASPIPVWAL